MARKPAGPEMVEKLEGSDEAKRRLRVVLETVRGERSVEDACAILGIGSTRFEELRKRALEAAVSALESRPAGRPAAALMVESGAVVRLQQEVEELKAAVLLAHVREELAIGLPHRGREKKR